MTRPIVDVTLFVASDGAIWDVPHWLVAVSLEDPLPTSRVVEIKDGTEEPRPLLVYVMPDRKTT